MKWRTSAFFNDISYVKPLVPTLYSLLTTGSAASDPRVYGTYTNPFVLKKGDTIDLVLNNDDAGKHPFHLHGHTFQVIARSDANAGHYNASNHPAFPSIPIRRDTLLVRPNGYFVVRFKADNPGKFSQAVVALDQSDQSSEMYTTDALCHLSRHLVLSLPYRMAHGCRTGRHNH